MFYKIHGVRVLVYKNKQFLILKRVESDKNDAGLWDIPGEKIKLGVKPSCYRSYQRLS